MPFELDPRLAADTLPTARLSLCRLLLMKDCRWPWLILVPQRAGIVELYDLSAEERGELIEEAAACGRALKSATGCSKINIGALGNLVPQFHLHVIARDTADPAWPGPVWGTPGAQRYAAGAAELLIDAIRKALQLP